MSRSLGAVQKQKNAEAGRGRVKTWLFHPYDVSRLSVRTSLLHAYKELRICMATHQISMHMLRWSNRVCGSKKQSYSEMNRQAGFCHAAMMSNFEAVRMFSGSTFDRFMASSGRWPRPSRPRRSKRAIRASSPACPPRPCHVSFRTPSK